MQISEVFRVFTISEEGEQEYLRNLRNGKKLQLQKSPTTCTPAMTVFARRLRALCSERCWVPAHVPPQHPGRATSCTHLQPQPDTAKLSKPWERRTHSLQTHPSSAPRPKQGLEIPPELASISSRWVLRALEEK